jgi:lipid-A-disaccharide synthase
LKIGLVAGEASGDLLAASVLGALRSRQTQAGEIDLAGIGGPAMAEQGFDCWWPSEMLAVHGYAAALKVYPKLLALRRSLGERLLQWPAGLFVGVDAPDFNLGLETRLRAGGVKTMHFISPSIWAWRGGRINKIAKAVSHMLVVFPFEEAIYRQAGIPVTYVGYPLAEVIPLQPDVAQARAVLGLPAAATVVALLPGSRLSELKYNAAAFVGAAQLLAQRDPAIRFVAPMAGDKQKQYFGELIAQAGLRDVPIQVLDGKSHVAIAAADAVLVASGTATLEVALFKKPMVIAYKMMRASWHIMRHMGYQPWVGLPNILAREFVVPELLQDAATPQALADALHTQLHDAPHKEQLQRRFTEMHHALLRDTARESAQAVLNLIGRAT